MSSELGRLLPCPCGNREIKAVEVQADNGETKVRLYCPRCAREGYEGRDIMQARHLWNICVKLRRGKWE